MSAVFWPAVWEGVWSLARLDLPRMRVQFQNQTWTDPGALLEALEQTVGALWSRWVFVFLNQATMYDVFACVSKDVEHAFGAQLCGGDSPVHMHIHATDDELRLDIIKLFEIRQRTHTPRKLEQPRRVSTLYRITFFPEMKIHLDWKYE